MKSELILKELFDQKRFSDAAAAIDDDQLRPVRIIVSLQLPHLHFSADDIQLIIIPLGPNGLKLLIFLMF